jgi:hypothetical protein
MIPIKDVKDFLRDFYMIEVRQTAKSIRVSVPVHVEKIRDALEIEFIPFFGTRKKGLKCKMSKGEIRFISAKTPEEMAASLQGTLPL